jgi:general secretion pathway protein D
MEAESVKLGELIKLVSDRTGVNISSSDAASGKSVSIFLRNITVAASVEEICRATGLWFRGEGDIIRIMTMEEYEKNLSSFREESMETFTLLYPNVVEVAGVIYGLYPDRTLLSLGEQELQEDGENDLSRRFRRFRVIEENGGSQFMEMDAPTATGSSGNTGSGMFSFSRGGALSRLSQWEQIRSRRTRRDSRDATISQTDAKRIDSAEKAGDGERYEELLVEKRAAANIFVSISRKNNMLIIRTSDTKAMEEIRRLVKSLDVPTPMVLMEVKVMELQLDDNYDASFQFNFHPKRATHTVGNHGELIGEVLQPALAGMNPTFSFKVLNDDIEARIRLMQKDGRAKVLATPTLLTANNEVSRIFSGKELPIVTGWTAGETTVPENGVPYTTQPTPEIERKDIGTMLLITPNINADRTVTIHLMQENSESDETMKTRIPVPGYDDLSVQYVESRSLTGTFVANDKMSILAGGLIKETESDTYYRTPFFGSIPLIGWFFRGTEKVKQRKELVIIITPHVISTPFEGGKISDELVKALSAHPARDGAKSMGTLRKSDGGAAEHSVTNDLNSLIK